MIKSKFILALMFATGISSIQAQEVVYLEDIISFKYSKGIEVNYPPSDKDGSFEWIRVVTQTLPSLVEGETYRFVFKNLEPEFPTTEVAGKVVTSTNFLGANFTSIQILSSIEDF